VPLVACGLLGLCVGLLWQRLLSQRTIIAVTIVLALVPALPLLPQSPLIALTHQTLIGVSHLVALLGLALVLVSVRVARPVARALSVVGQYALFCFRGHRLLLGIAVASHFKTVLRPELVYSIYVTGAMAMLIAVCRLRNTWPALDRSLRSIFL
jgi:hypothetical protein